jgi:hypothetical protein
VKGEQNSYMLLFDTIDKMDAYHEAALKKATSWTNTNSAGQPETLLVLSIARFLGSILSEQQRRNKQMDLQSGDTL